MHQISVKMQYVKLLEDPSHVQLGSSVVFETELIYHVVGSKLVFQLITTTQQGYDSCPYIERLDKRPDDLTYCTKHNTPTPWPFCGHFYSLTVIISLIISKDCFWPPSPFIPQQGKCQLPSTAVIQPQIHLKLHLKSSEWNSEEPIVTRKKEKAFQCTKLSKTIMLPNQHAFLQTSFKDHHFKDYFCFLKAFKVRCIGK